MELNKYLRTKIGKRFILVRDNVSGYIGLFDKQNINEVIMSNCEKEKIGNAKIIKEAKGDVLIGGFGIGLIVLPIMNKLEVTSITIIEKFKEVIDIVASQLPLNDKVKIINEDVCTFKPKQKYDTVYFDTIPPNWDEGRKISDLELVEIYKEKYLIDGGYCDCFRGHY